MPESYFIEVLSDVLIEALTIGIIVEVLTDVNVNVSAAVMTGLKYPMSIP